MVVDVELAGSGRAVYFSLDLDLVGLLMVEIASARARVRDKFC